MGTGDVCRAMGKFVKFWMLCVFGFLPLTLAIRSNVSNHNPAIMSQLKILNKPYVKSIESPDGDIIDCVLINRQPAFDNMLLKNHTIQMQPSFYPDGFFSKLTTHEEPFSQLWQTKGSCPTGTIPIRRTREEDLLRANSFQSYGKKTPQTIPNPGSPPSGQTNGGAHEHAVRYVQGGKIFGAKARINVWNPRVQQAGEFSLAQIWVLAGDFDKDLNSVEAGWQVSPALYGDTRTRLFAYWTRDSYRNTGCYNMLCSAFVQIDKQTALGAAISPISSYNGNQYQISVLIWKDPKSGNWWLRVGDKSIGYWPNDVFTHLREFGSAVEWGGEVVNAGVGGKHTTTEMGSGRFSGEGVKKAAKFANIGIVDESNALKTPVDVKTVIESSSCYDLTVGKNDVLGEFFFFGGPGRNPNCP